MLRGSPREREGDQPEMVIALRVMVLTPFDSPREREGDQPEMVIALRVMVFLALEAAAADPRAYH
jgi:hypothetical protein